MGRQPNRRAPKLRQTIPLNVASPNNPDISLDVWRTSVLSSQGENPLDRAKKSTHPLAVKGRWAGLEFEFRNRLGSRVGKHLKHGFSERGADLGKKPGTAEIMVGPVVTKLAPAFHIFLPSPWPVVDAINIHVKRERVRTHVTPEMPSS